MNESWKIKEDLLEFQEETHTYLVNGKKVESITQLLHKFFPSKYDGIDPEVLKRASMRGSLIHAIIQVYEQMDIDDEECSELQNWKLIKKLYNIDCIDNEVPIILRIGEKTYAGRLDLVLKHDNKLGLADIKTTSVLDKEYLTMQLNLYRLGFQQSYDKDIEFISGVHLRKDIRKYVELPIKEEQIIEMIKEKEEIE